MGGTASNEPEVDNPIDQARGRLGKVVSIGELVREGWRLNGSPNGSPSDGVVGDGRPRER